ncbi:hypothetical protein [Microbacterium sp. GXS0129]|uniref:hypothetical protein n=1 Tax=Microbacterium sp. GXS0129 TaxID=3377836 RepID=UPI00383AA127
MTITTFEEPAKTELRAACEVAIDQAGYAVATTLQRVPLPGLNGVLKGEVQSLNADGERTFYYVRTVAQDAVPKWLANIARASHELHAGEMYIVVREYSAQFMQSCIAAGAGLLLLNEDLVFEVVVPWAESSPQELEAALTEEINQLRRSMERKLKLTTDALTARYERTTGLVADMEDLVAASYISKVESEFKAADDWSIEISRLLDGVTSKDDATTLARVRELIEAGPASSDSR